MINTQFKLLEKELHLERYPVKHQHKSLQAWDAADEYLIEYVHDLLAAKTEPDEASSGQHDTKILLLNDEFGALACWFHAYQPVSMSDSWVSRKSAKVNAWLNTINEDDVQYIDALSDLTSVFTAPINYVLIKIPRSLALLEHQLISLQTVLDENTVIIAAGKVKSVQNSVLKLFEKYIGITTTSLAKKKSRLIFCQYQGIKTAISPYPTVVEDPAIDFSLSNHANVFCREHLDIGARLLLKHLPDAMDKKVVDCGCGNGVLGLAILQQYPSAHVTFVDESFMAVQSAKDNLMLMQGHVDNADFIVSNCLEEFIKDSPESVDIVLCNPPFHQQNAVTDHVAHQMFTDAKKALKVGGELRVVGNRHLDYPIKLKKTFGGYKDVGSNAKFSVLSTYKAKART